MMVHLPDAQRAIESPIKVGRATVGQISSSRGSAGAPPGTKYTGKRCSESLSEKATIEALILLTGSHPVRIPRMICLREPIVNGWSQANMRNGYPRIGVTSVGLLLSPEVDTELRKG